MAVLPGGKLLVAGSIGDDFGIVRYNADGSVDKTFGKAGARLAPGVVTTHFFGPPNPSSPDDFGNAANAIALLPGGKFLLAGDAVSDAEDFPASAFAVARYNADGSLDTTFGTGAAPGKGKVVTVPPGSGTSVAFAAAVEPDGKIVVAGEADYSFIDFDSEPGEVRTSLAVLRYNPDGGLDRSFGQGGAVLNASASPADAVVVQRDGKIDVAAGEDVFRFND